MGKMLNKEAFFPQKLLERVRNGPSVGCSFAARWARMVLKRCSAALRGVGRPGHAGVEHADQRGDFETLAP